MEWQAILTLLTLATVLGALVITRVSADLVLMAALAFLLITGILGPAEALAGFANPGVLRQAGRAGVWICRCWWSSLRLLPWVMR